MDIDPRITQDSDAQLDIISQDVSNTSNGLIATPAHERWTKLPKTRGRQPKDPHAQSIRFMCRDIQELETQLRDYLRAPTAPAEHTTLEFVYPVSSAFSVYSADIRNKRNTQQDEKSQHLYGRLDKSAISVIDALAQTIDPKDQMRRQKAIAKVCVEACERADGFRYSFHNNWLSREDEACRFSYFCNDSTLNKGRAANEGANTVGKKMRKAVYDCQGLIAIKFSLTKQSLEVHYKHNPVHQTYADRAPPPRKDSKRYKLMQIFEPEKLAVDQVKRSKTQPPTDASDNKRPRKRRATEPPAEHEVEQEDIYLTGEDFSTEVETLDLTADFVRSTDYVQQHIEGQDHQETPPLLSSRTQTRPPLKRPPVKPCQSAVPIPSRVETPRGGLTWVGPNEVNAASRPRKQRAVNDSPTSKDESLTNAKQSTNAGTISMSDFEALKAKLEAAEQRIRNLEAEKQSVPTNRQAPSWNHPPPPPPPPPPYPYAYQTGPFPYSPTTVIPHHYPSTTPRTATAAAASSSVTTPTHPHQLNSVSHPPFPRDRNDLGAYAGNESNVTGEKTREQIRKTPSSNVRAFKPYIPKPPRPVLDAQRQDANRPTSNTSGPQDSQYS